LVSFSGNLYLAIPSLVLGLGFFLLSQQYVLPENVWPLIALLVANILISLPFALSVFNPMMQKTALRYDKLVSSLNIGYIQRWKEIELPYLLPSIAYVFALSFCFSFGDLGIISLFGSQDFSTLPWYLYGLLGSYRTNDAAGVALILLALTLLVFMGIPKLFRRDNA
jgi:thiamine transport system permease protein